MSLSLDTSSSKNDASVDPAWKRDILDKNADKRYKTEVIHSKYPLVIHFYSVISVKLPWFSLELALIWA